MRPIPFLPWWMLFGSIWGSFLGQALMLLLLQYNATLSRGRRLDFFLQSAPFHNCHKFFHELTWSQNLGKFNVNLREIKSVVIWFSINFLKTFGAHLACLSVVIPKFWHSINWEKWVQPINIILCNTLRNTKICRNKSKVCLLFSQR